jgi:hypothetical protein
MSRPIIRIRCTAEQTLWEPDLAQRHPALEGTRLCAVELQYLVPGEPPLPLPSEPWAVALLLAHSLLRFRPQDEVAAFSHSGFPSVYDWLARRNGPKAWFRERFGFVSHRGKSARSVVLLPEGLQPDQIEVRLDGREISPRTPEGRQTLLQLFAAQHDPTQWQAGLTSGTVPRLLEYLATPPTSSPLSHGPLTTSWDLSRIPRRLEHELRDQLVSGESRLIAVRGPKQFGKTSLLESLQAEGQGGLADRSVLLSFRDLDTTGTQTAEDVYAALREELEYRLQISPVSVGSGGKELHRLRLTVQAALAQSPRLWLLFDDVDRLFDESDRCAQVFGTFSEWWSKGQRGPEREVWQGLRMVLTHRRDPLPFFAQHDESSPFSRAQRQSLAPFSELETLALGERFGLDSGTLGKVHANLVGHPALTGRALEFLAGTEGATWQSLATGSLAGEGPLGTWMVDRARAVRLQGDRTWQRLLAVAKGNSKPTEADAWLVERGLVFIRGNHLGSIPLFEEFLLRHGRLAGSP